ncbi:hypothetical protein GCM10009844_12890 [Nocardioides koreensis]|uniref:Endonuclease/exonuclease/phosphatase domain-containing protein n=1 Tax=Nocardioides koreensis TaxID=433651 RepID=A0ABN2ZGY4_9ACTN
MRFRTRARLAVASLLTVAVAIAIPGSVQSASADAGSGGRGGELTVMTQNLYLGSSLDPALVPDQTPEDFVRAVAQIYGTAVFTNFPKRAEAIADTIDAQEPDLIGLQEVTRWIAQPLVAGANPPSYDFLAILQAALQKRGLDYSVAAVSENADIGPAPLVAPGFGCDAFTDPTKPNCVVKLQDRDVILVNDDTAGLVVKDSQSGDYATQQTFPVPSLPGTPPAPPVSFARGWAYIDATYNATKFRFVTTHLEVEGFPTVQEAQAREFLAGPAKTGGAVIATGDFNSDAEPAPTDTNTTTYTDLTKSWFKDAWAVNGGANGDTCCQNSTLTNPVSQLKTRIDLILTHGPVRTQSAEVVNDELISNTPPLWASDHAGVVATLSLPGSSGAN